MNVPARRLARSHGVLRLIVAAMAILALLPALPGQVRAAGTATITVNSFMDDGTTPLPFTRFQITASDGTIYGPLETTPPDGKVTFTVQVGDETTFEILAETPPACGIAPDPTEVGPLTDGEAVSVDVEIGFLSDCDLGSISVYAYTCPDTIDAGATDYAVFRDGCVETVDGKTFKISEKNGSQSWNIVTGAYGISGRAPLVGLKPGTYQIEDTDPADDTKLVAFCLTYPGIPNGSSQPDDVEQAKVKSDAISVDLDGQRIACDFFAVPSNGETEQPADEPSADDENGNVDEGNGNVDDENGNVDEGDANDATLEIHLVACEPGYAGNAFFEDCHDNGIEGRTVSIDGPGGFSDSMQTVLPNSPGPGVARFEGLAAGKYKIAEDIPGDTATYYALCSMADSDELVDFQYDDSTSEAIVLTLAESTGVVCDFYIVPNQQTDQSDDNTDDNQQPADEPPADQNEDDVDQGGEDVNEGAVSDASLEVHLVACPPGYGGGNFFEDCHDNGIEGRTITIEGPNNFTDSMQTVLPASPGPGVARFEGLAGGEYKVSEDIPGDTATYYAYCSMADSAEVVDFQYDDSTSEAIVLTIGDGEDIVCDISIVPEQQFQPGRITVTKYTCPVGYDNDGINALLADCTDKTDGVTFTLSPHSGGSDITKVSGSAGDGRARFSNLAPGNYDLSEDVPGEFSTPVVWCNVAGGEWYQKTVSSSDATTFDVDEGDDIRCAWFNLPEDLSGGGSLRIHKSICPEGLTSGFYDTCYDDTLADVTFVANGPGGYENSLTTGKKGVVTFTDLNAGTYTITELPPDGVNVAVYVVVCTRDGKSYDFSYDDSTGLRINVRIPAGAEIVCDWYNVPPAKPKPGASGTITIYKYLCQGRSDNKYDWDNDCENYGAGAEFDLTRLSNGVTLSGATSGNGTLVFSNLANGAYSLDETTGDWCHAEADHVDANGNVKVVDGGNTNVYIYNCSKPVNRLPSTGTGPAGGPGGVAGTMALWGIASLLGLVALRRVRQPRPVPAVRQIV